MHFALKLSILQALKGCKKAACSHVIRHRFKELETVELIKQRWNCSTCLQLATIPTFGLNVIRWPLENTENKAEGEKKIKVSRFMFFGLVTAEYSSLGRRHAIFGFYLGLKIGRGRDWSRSRRDPTPPKGLHLANDANATSNVDNANNSENSPFE